MEEQNNSHEIVVRPDYDLQLLNFEKALLGFLDQLGLPVQGIFVSVEERQIIFQTVENVLKKIDEEKKFQSTYLSKFVAAVASGLFDAALNYLWDETIFELRKRVAQYDIAYFYDNAINNVEKRKKLNAVDDLIRIEDSELIYGAKEIGLITELGFKHLDYVRYMRNWVSAAHPNQNDITGLQLISWLQTCIREVISLPLSVGAVEIKRLLQNIKNSSISSVEAKEIATSCLMLTQEQINNLASGFFGIYTRLDINPQVRQNIHLLLPLLWDRVDEQTRQKLGLNYGKFAAINDQERKKLTRRFLEIVSAVSYIADDFKIPEIETAVENLLLAHRQMDNFYNEPAFARALKNIVGSEGKIPPLLDRTYVIGLVEVFLTNGNGVARNAEPTYRHLINLFDSRQALYAILSFSDDSIASKLQFPLCQKKYRELLEMMKIKVPIPAIQEIIEEIENFNGPLENLRTNKHLLQKTANMMKIVS